MPAISASRVRFIPRVLLISAAMLVPGSLSAQESRPDALDATDLHITGSLAHEWCRGWTLESRVAQSQLILVARVSSVSALNVVRGAKVNTALREYRFQPVRVLKGVFARDELSMTHSDLGLPAPDPASPPAFQQGQYLLLLLARNARRPSSFSCVSAANWAPTRQALPELTGPQDPIVSMTESLIAVTQTRSRRSRADLTLEQVKKLSGPAVVPLLSSLSERAFWAAQVTSAETLVDLMQHESRAIRSAATTVVHRIMEMGIDDDKETVEKFASALRNLLQSDEVDTTTRTSALRALGYSGETGRSHDWVGDLLVGHLREGRTNAERLAAASALADLDDDRHRHAAIESIDRLPLDEPSKRERSFLGEVVRFADTHAGPALLRRIQQKLVAGHPALTEITLLGQLKYVEAVPALLEAGIDEVHNDEQALAIAFEALRDERAVSQLVKWLQHVNFNVRWAAFGALSAIDSGEAIAAIRLRMKSEHDLRLKLRMASALGRHGIIDGYPFAIEHVADPGITQYAAEALAAIGDPRAGKQLHEILEQSNDAQWNAAALHALAVMGDASVKPRLVEILDDRRHSLLAAAITASRELGDKEMIAALVPLISSRNFTVASSSIDAIRVLGVAENDGAPATNDAMNDAATELLKLLDDPYVDIRLRIAALDTLDSIEDKRLSDTVRKLADRPELENTALMQRIDQYLSTARRSAG